MEFSLEENLITDLSVDFLYSENGDFYKISIKSKLNPFLWFFIVYLIKNNSFVNLYFKLNFLIIWLYFVNFFTLLTLILFNLFFDKYDKI